MNFYVDNKTFILSRARITYVLLKTRLQIAPFCTCYIKFDISQCHISTLEGFSQLTSELSNVVKLTMHQTYPAFYMNNQPQNN